MHLSTVLLSGLLFTAASAVPAELAKREQKITWSFCNSCIAGSCEQRWYMHWGDSKLGSCNDSSFNYDDEECTTKGGTIPTPSGSGSWSLTGSCQAGTDQLMGEIHANGNTYTCYRANNQGYSNYCGVTYACNVYMSCYGP